MFKANVLKNNKFTLNTISYCWVEFYFSLVYSLQRINKISKKKKQSKLGEIINKWNITQQSKKDFCVYIFYSSQQSSSKKYIFISISNYYAPRA